MGPAPDADAAFLVCWMAPFVLGFGRENYGRLAQSSIATQFLNYDEINPVPCKAS